jgi:hypothetical protein
MKSAHPTVLGAVTVEELHRAVLVIQQSRFIEVMTIEEWTSRLRASAEVLGAAHNR